MGTLVVSWEVFDGVLFYGVLFQCLKHTVVRWESECRWVSSLMKWNEREHKTLTVLQTHVWIFPIKRSYDYLAHCIFAFRRVKCHQMYGNVLCKFGGIFSKPSENWFDVNPIFYCQRSLSHLAILPSEKCYLPLSLTPWNTSVLPITWTSGRSHVCACVHALPSHTWWDWQSMIRGVNCKRMCGTDVITM